MAQLFLTEPHYDPTFDSFSAEIQLTVGIVTIYIGKLIVDSHGVILNTSNENAMYVIENMPVLNMLHLSALITTALSEAFMNLPGEEFVGYQDAFKDGDVIVLES